VSFKSSKPSFQLSKDPKRNKQYDIILGSILNHSVTVADIAKFGSTMMHKEKLHPHFFGTHSLKINALYLTFFSLQLPYEYTNPKYLHKKITEVEGIEILKLFERRISERIPVEYITEEAYYLGNKFYVNEHVLIPRSLMNTRFTDFLKAVPWENFRVLDLCTGSGCIGITLALLHPKIQVDLSDISKDALNVAAINVKQHGLTERVNCIHSNLFENIHDKYDLIITNPPYVTEREYQAQPAEVKNEPSRALKAGKRWLGPYSSNTHPSQTIFKSKWTVNCRNWVYGIQTVKKYLFKHSLYLVQISIPFWEGITFRYSDWVDRLSR